MCVYFGDAQRQGRVITSFEEWEVAGMTTERAFRGCTRDAIRQNRYQLLTVRARSQGIAAFYFYRSKAEGGGGEGGLMMLLRAIWQLDHNRWQLAIRAIQRALREHRRAQSVSIIKA